jgi:hypothetical protein
MRGGNIPHRFTHPPFCWLKNHVNDAGSCTVDLSIVLGLENPSQTEISHKVMRARSRTDITFPSVPKTVQLAEMS